MKWFSRSLLVVFFVSLFTSLLSATPYDPNKTVTIYVHGFDSHGYRRSGIYGEDTQEDFFADIPTYVGLPTTAYAEDLNKSNLFAATTYYGDTPPEYYTAQDITDIDTVTQQYGGGIPRYAMIVAKYAKHLMQRTGAQQVNFVSGSMGSLVVRWLIEKDAEGLASSKKIARWLSIEGVVNGNYAASKSILFKLYNEVENLSIDIKQMKYKWIERNLSNPRKLAQSPYYKDILIGFETSTDDHAKEGFLTKLMIIHGIFQPNDGYQIASDTFFSDVLPPYRMAGQNPTHSYLHDTHLGIKNDPALWAEVANFLTSNKRVRITLVDAKVDDIKEKNHWYYKKLPAEIVFESRVYSPALQLQWGINRPVSERLYTGGVPPIVKYGHKHETKTIYQTLFDDFVLPSETSLTVALNAREIDGDLRYKVYESFRDRKYSMIGDTTFSVPLTEGTYPFTAGKFSGHVKVELVNYPFNLLGESDAPDISILPDQNDTAERGTLVSATKVLSKNSDYMQQRVKALQLFYPQLSNTTVHGVDAYKVIYNTVDAEGNPVQASGLVTVPQEINGTVSLISDQHGTIFARDHAPSVAAPLTRTGTLITALKGYAVAMPDYIGYGSTANLQHPYLMKKPIADSVVDMIKASRALLDAQQIPYDDRLFLTGYSEGGYATMAAAEEIQQNHPELQVTAAAPMAGSYDLPATGSSILSHEVYPAPHLPVFLIYSYDYYLGLNMMADTFNEPYKTEIETYFAEKRKGNIIPLTLPHERDVLYTQNFLQSFFAPQPNAFKEALAANSVYDWTPQMPMHLYHCEGDEIVDVQNSQTAYDHFTQNGAPDVALILQPGGSHESCAFDFYVDAIGWFDSMQ